MVERLAGDVQDEPGRLSRSGRGGRDRSGYSEEKAASKAAVGGVMAFILRM
ncbi:hypothetical protein FHR33_006680 [Nonomuraea dietziae]|uniref:Uncharacterized protein n=1 Tax=Nonomuraea dietziae TaxID=65515 RepID=A0A7W5VC06_9ACTN|nr:hypothetical protein [Nonomuraea dietziae]